MYIYSFNRFAWFDRVFKLNISDDKSWWYQKILKKGNLVAYQDDFFLCLWNEVSFSEQYEYKYEIKNENLNLILKDILSDNTLKMIDWMVYYRYSSYKSVMKYFISFDIEKLDKRLKIKDTRLKRKKTVNNKILIEDWKISFSKKEINGQQLVIFPDLWTLFNTLDNDILSGKWNILLSSNDSQNKKDKNWWMIKSGEIKNIFCTHSEIFQDWNDLQNIIMLDPYKRYYENQQDPRYSVKTVVQRMCEVYWAELNLVTQ